MKNLIKFLTLALAVMLLCMAVCAEEVRPVFVKLNGEAVDCASYGQEATIVDGRTMVPLRAIFEALGASVEWNAETRTVNSKLGDTEISLTIGENKLIRNGKEVALDVPAMIMNNRTLVPVRAVSESFGVAVEWDKNTRTVVLTQTEMPLVEKPETPASPEGMKDVPAEAMEVLTKCYDATINFNLDEAAKYTTKPELLTAVGMSGIDDLFTMLGFDHATLTEIYMASVGEGQEDARVFCEDVADVCVDIIKGVYGTMKYEVVSCEVINDKEIAYAIEVYIPDTTTFAEDYEMAIINAIAKASEELSLMAEELADKTEKEIFEVYGELFKKNAEPMVSEMLGSITLVSSGEADGKLVKVNGEWRVELDEEDVEGFESIAENGFAGILG